MEKTIHIKTARVTGHDSDMSPRVERNVIKLEDGDNFRKFVRLMKLNNYLKSEPPTVAKVMAKKKDKWVEVDSAPYQAIVKAALGNAPEAKKEGSDKETIAKLLERIEKLEAAGGNGEGGSGEGGNDDDDDDDKKGAIIKSKAEALGIAFPANIKNETLLAKIQAIEPDFGFEDDLN